MILTIISNKFSKMDMPWHFYSWVWTAEIPCSMRIRNLNYELEFADNHLGPLNLPKAFCFFEKLCSLGDGEYLDVINIVVKICSPVLGLKLLNWEVNVVDENRGFPMKGFSFIYYTKSKYLIIFHNISNIHNIYNKNYMIIEQYW